MGSHIAETDGKVFERRAAWFFDGLALQTASARIATGISAFAKDPHLKKL
jgi:hypothetical protein